MSKNKLTDDEGPDRLDFTRAIDVPQNAREVVLGKQDQAQRDDLLMPTGTPLALAPAKSALPSPSNKSTGLKNKLVERSPSPNLSPKLSKATS